LAGREIAAFYGGLGHRTDPETAPKRETFRRLRMCSLSAFSQEVIGMDFVKKLVGERVYLSPLVVEHASLWYRWHNDLETALLAASPGHRSPGSEAEFREVIETFIKRKWHPFLIVEAESDEPVGWCALIQVDPIGRRAMLAALIGEKEEWSKGLGEDALRLLLDYGFSMLNLNSIELIVHEDNVRAVRCYEKLGFQIVGRKREARIHGPLKQDILLMDILAAEFESPLVVPTIEGS
jgi:RimJ/RimL family protein N-acetyltransferase